MLRIAFLSFAVLLSSSLTSASPTLLPRACVPNFQGQAQTIYAKPPFTDLGVYEWTPDSIAPGAHVTMHLHSFNDAFAQGEFLVEFTGEPSGSYRVKLAADTARSLALTAGSDDSLAFEVASPTTNPTQEFTITCDSCPSTDGDDIGLADKCIIGHPKSGKCVTGSDDGVTVKLANCDAAVQYSLRKSI